MTDKPIGLGAFNGGIRKQSVAVKRREVEKVPMYVPELKCTVYVVPGTDMATVIAKYRAQKEFERGLLRGNKK
jgi:hypothetical protein